MKVLFCAHRYLPELGGIPTVTDLICRHLSRQGWQVAVATTTRADAATDFHLPYEVLRALSTTELRRRMRTSDCVVMQHLSIRHLLPLWLSGAPSLTVLHMGIETWGFKATIYSLPFRLHVLLARHTAAVSDALRRHVPGVRAVLPNPYADALFQPAPSGTPVPVERLVFLGRLVSVKGVEFALEALGLLRARGHNCHLTIIGDGPSMPQMRSLAERLGLTGLVTFVGEKQAEEIPVLLRQHGTLLIPSNYFEAFGLVALEAMACGLHVVAFRRGGLPEAVGEAGLTCSESTAESLAGEIERLLTDGSLREQLRSRRADHLARFQVAEAGGRYRRLIESIVAESGRSTRR